MYYRYYSITVTSTCTMYVHILYMYIQYELFSYYKKTEYQSINL